MSPKKVFLFLAFSFLFFIAHTQTILENPNAQVYPFLQRMAQKGLIQLDDIIQPIARNKIYDALRELDKNNSSLSSIEKTELAFYLNEYAFGTKLINDSVHISLLAKDNYKRWRTVSVQSNDFNINIDPIVSAKYIAGGTKSFNQVSNGIQLWGNIGKKWGFQLFYRDYTEKGNVRNYYTINGNNFTREEPSTGIIIVGTNNEKSINYSDVRATISYTFNKGSISFGKDRLLWGFGESGRIVLSDRAPSYPLVRLDYNPFIWLRFNYVHAWLNSNLLDSNKTYSTYTGGVSGDVRINNISKYMATHSIQFIPTKGLTIAIGESIIFSDKHDPGFLVPINIFKIYDNNRSNYVINSGSNGQYFFQLSSRNQVKNMHIYASMFIDEIRVSEIFNKNKSRNQLGYTIGASKTDVFTPYLTIGGEYTRVNPFVYNNLILAQKYTQYNYSLGDWMGSNFDRKTIFAKYTPYPKLKLYAKVELTNKGSEGDIVQQYTAEPQPKFLFGYQKARTDFYLQATYEWYHNLYFNGSFQWLQERIATANNKRNTDALVSIGFSFGLH